MFRIVLLLAFALVACSSTPGGGAIPTPTSVEGRIDLADADQFTAYAGGPGWWPSDVAYTGTFEADGTFRFALDDAPKTRPLDENCADTGAPEWTMVGAVIATQGALPTDSADPVPDMHVANLAGMDGRGEYLVAWLYAEEDLTLCKFYSAGVASIDLEAGWTSALYYVDEDKFVAAPVPSAAEWETTVHPGTANE